MNFGTRLVLVVGVVGAWLLFSKKSAASPSVPGGSLIADDVVASFYGGSFFEGKTTASGEPFASASHTAAHRTLPFGTRLLVTDLDTGRDVTVKVNDRGPFSKDASGRFTREIDLSSGAAAAMGLDIQRGLARVRLERV